MYAAEAAAVLPRQTLVDVLRVIVIKNVVQVAVLLRVYDVVHGGPLAALNVHAHHH